MQILFKNNNNNLFNNCILEKNKAFIEENKNLKDDNMQIKQDFTEELPPISQEILDEIKAITEDKIKPTPISSIM